VRFQERNLKNVAQPRCKEIRALRIPPESIRGSGHLKEYEKKKGKGHNMLKSGDPG
jgi:hypothetical protein